MERFAPNPPQPRVVLDEGVVERVRIAVSWLDEVEAERGDDAYRALTECARRYQRDGEGKTVGQIDGVAAARRLYRSFGIDPTSTRPSSEALLKRALKGKPLYRLNTLVDAGNLVSLESLLPLGLYDRDLIRGEVARVREGRPGEEYPGIRKGSVHLGGRLCIADELGPFGSPTSDSFRTRITETTRRFLVVVFAPAELERPRLEAVHRRVGEVFTSYAGGILRNEMIL